MCSSDLCIQVDLEYSTRTHHSNMDLYDRLQAGDLEQAAAIMAWFVYNTASRPEMLPRKVLPKPRPNRGEFGQGTGPTPAPAGGGTRPPADGQQSRK